MENPIKLRWMDDLGKTPILGNARFTGIEPWTWANPYEKWENLVNILENLRKIWGKFGKTGNMVDWIEKAKITSNISLEWKTSRRIFLEKDMIGILSGDDWKIGTSPSATQGVPLNIKHQAQDHMWKLGIWSFFDLKIHPAKNWGFNHCKCGHFFHSLVESMWLYRKHPNVGQRVIGLQDSKSLNME